jgi:hypothetical protein
MRFLKIGLIVVVLVVIGVGGSVYVQLNSIEVERISDDLFVLRGLGGLADRRRHGDR